MSRWSPTVHRYDPQNFEHLQSALRFGASRQNSLAAQGQMDRRTTEMEKTGESTRSHRSQQTERLKQMGEMADLLYGQAAGGAYQQLGLQKDPQYGHEPVSPTVQAPLGAAAADAPTGMMETGEDLRSRAEAQSPQQAGADLTQVRLGDARARIQLPGGWSMNKMGEAPAARYEEGQLGETAGRLESTGYGEDDSWLRARGMAGKPNFEEALEQFRRTNEVSTQMQVEGFKKEFDHDSYVRDASGGAGGDKELYRSTVRAAFMQDYMAEFEANGGIRDDALRTVNAKYGDGYGIMMTPGEVQKEMDSWQRPWVRAGERGGPGIEGQPEGFDEMQLRYDQLVAGGTLSPDQALMELEREWAEEGRDAAQVRKFIYARQQQQRGDSWSDMGSNMLGFEFYSGLEEYFNQRDQNR